jgi:DNA-binding CsgD family transcriptional regulator
MPRITFQNGNPAHPPPSKIETDARLCNLISDILSIIESCPRYGPVLDSENVAEHVILEIDFKGERYRLLKMAQADREFPGLSPREQEIARMVARGRQTKIIAAELGISSWTVSTHLRRIFAKLGVTSRAAMVAKLAEFVGSAKPRRSFDRSLPETIMNSRPTCVQLRVTSKKKSHPSRSTPPRHS